MAGKAPRTPVRMGMPSAGTSDSGRPMRTWPVGAADAACTAARASAACCSISCACWYSRRPDSVGCTPRELRSSRDAFISASSDATCWLRADCAMCSAAAARDRLPKSTICTK